MSEMHRGCVLDRRALTVRTVRIALGSAGLIGMVPRPAQDIELLLGDDRTVRSVRDLLEARGVARDRIFAKGYWNGQAAPGRS